MNNWQKGRPSPEAVKAHAEKFPIRGFVNEYGNPWAFPLGLWMVRQRGEGHVRVVALYADHYGAQQHALYTERYDGSENDEWKPLTANGDDVPSEPRAFVDVLDVDGNVVGTVTATEARDLLNRGEAVVNSACPLVLRLPWAKP